MPNRFIYVVQAGEKDLSRWLNLGVKANGLVHILLGDLCHPGRVSALRSVECGLELLEDGLHSGTVQIVSEEGYMLARRIDDAILIEFRGNADAFATKVEVNAQEVMDRLVDLRRMVTAPA